MKSKEAHKSNKTTVPKNHNISNLKEPTNNVLVLVPKLSSNLDWYIGNICYPVSENQSSKDNLTSHRATELFNSCKAFVIKWYSA